MNLNSVYNLLKLNIRNRTVKGKLAIFIIFNVVALLLIELLNYLITYYWINIYKWPDQSISSISLGPPIPITAWGSIKNIITLFFIVLFLIYVRLLFKNIYKYFVNIKLILERKKYCVNIVNIIISILLISISYVFIKYIILTLMRFHYYG